MQACEEPQLTASHQAAAFGALAGFLDQSAASNSDLKRLCIGVPVFDRCFDIYLLRCEGCPAKPIRQLLITLIKILGLQDEVTAAAKSLSVTQRCLSVILNHDDPSGVKAAMLALEMILSKDRLHAQDFLLVVKPLLPNMDVFSGAWRSVDTNELFQVAQTFIYNVLEWTNLVHIAPPAGLFLFTFCRLAKTVFRDSSTASNPLWLSPVREIQVKDSSYLEMLERYVLPDLLQVDSASVVGSLGTILERLRDNDHASVQDTDVRFCLLVLKCGKASFKKQHLGMYLRLVPGLS